jgi:large subunit ribosomal protein L3
VRTAPDRHPLADPEDGRLAHAARPPGRVDIEIKLKGLVGKKLGMTQLFDEESGGVTPVTVIQAGPCPVVAVRTPDTDGYEAVQLAWEPVADRKVSKPERGHLAKAGIDGAYRHLVEFRGHFADAVQGESVTVEIFQPGDKVKVSGTGIGKGFQGTIKRHNFHRGPVTHGSHNVRKPGSIGASATPSRVFKGQKMAGRMGGKRATQVGLTVHSIDPERNLLLVKGAVPGPTNGLVEIREDVR